MLRDLRGARVHVCNYADLVENPVDGPHRRRRESSSVGRGVRRRGPRRGAVATVHPGTASQLECATRDLETTPVEINELMKLTLDQRGRHDAFDMGTDARAGMVGRPVARRASVTPPVGARGDRRADDAQHEPRSPRTRSSGSRVTRRRIRSRLGCVAASSARWTGWRSTGSRIARVRDGQVKGICHELRTSGGGEATVSARDIDASDTTFVIWFTGISGAGKSTIALDRGGATPRAGLPVHNLDGDALRHGSNRDLGFSDDDRVENIPAERRVGAEPVQRRRDESSSWPRSRLSDAA